MKLPTPSCSLPVICHGRKCSAEAGGGVSTQIAMRGPCFIPHVPCRPPIAAAGAGGPHQAYTMTEAALLLGGICVFTYAACLHMFACAHSQTHEPCHR